MILVYGDSLSAAYGIPAERGWAALLARRLSGSRLDYAVANASISGETTAGGRARLARVLAQQRPAVVILELGANDGLRGLPIAEMKANLGAMAAASRRAGARVLVVGMRLPPNYGAEYTREFHAAFGEVAKRHGATLVPFLLDGVADDQFQPDLIHPSAPAQPKLLDNIWKALEPLLKKR